MMYVFVFANGNVFFVYDEKAYLNLLRTLVLGTAATSGNNCSM